MKSSNWVNGVLIATLMMVASSGCESRMVPLTKKNRETIENEVYRLNYYQIKQVHKRMEHRDSFGGLHDQIGNAGPETWYQRYQAEIRSCEKIIAGYERILERGTVDKDYFR